MGNYGTLPMTGIGTMSIGGLAVASPMLAVAAATLIIAGFLLLRVTRPKKIDIG